MVKKSTKNIFLKSESQTIGTCTPGKCKLPMPNCLSLYIYLVSVMSSTLRPKINTWRRFFKMHHQNNNDDNIHTQHSSVNEEEL